MGEQATATERSVHTLSAPHSERDQTGSSLSAQLANRTRILNSLTARLADADHSIESLLDNLAARDRTIQTLVVQKAERDTLVATQTADRERLVGELSAQLAVVTRSKAWRLALLLCMIRSTLVPPNSHRARILRRLANVAIRPYRKLRSFARGGVGVTPTLPKAPEVVIAAPPAPPIVPGAASPQLVRIEEIEPCAVSPGRIAVHLHLFHPDLAPEFAGYLRNIPFPFDLYVSVPDQRTREIGTRQFSELPACEKLKIEIVPNRGRDIAPMFCAFGEDLMRYDFFAHLHTKKSGSERGDNFHWREYLCTNLFGSERRVRQIFTLLAGSDPAGIVYPQTYSKMPCWANTWLADRASGEAWCQRLGIERPPRGYFDYPVGAMFWARSDALRPLFATNLTLEDFPQEAGQTDGTLAHCLERLPVLVSHQQGFRHAVIKDTANPNWSSWRLDQYSTRTMKAFTQWLRDPKLRAVAFDIFDTLLSRPLLDPEAVKEIVARRAGDGLGELYRRHRRKAEAVARQHAGRDVGMEAIYAEFVTLSGVSPQEADSLRQLEEQMEWHSVTLRADGLLMWQLARETGKRALLVSDMFLPRSLIESVLKENGVTDWDAIYLSNDVGLRKDSGCLYRHLLEKETLSPGQVLMVGDNEHSDVQVPESLGIAAFPVLRPIEVARAMPRLGALVEKAEHGGDLDNQLTMGLIVRRAFSPVFYGAWDPSCLVPPSPVSLGYSIVGPLVVGFIPWLVEQARRDGIERFYFLAREGESIKLAYDRWVNEFHDGPPSEYLVLSRRATTVPAIRGFNDILSIARTEYSANSAACFLEERFGVTLAQERWDELYRQNHWRPDGRVEIHGGRIAIDVLEFLHAVHEDIMAQVADERPAMRDYLRQIGLGDGERAAIVDIGYSATVQDRVSVLLEKPVHGYYMMTTDKANVVKDRDGSIVRGCFVDGISYSGANAPAIYLNSFTLEKMLGSMDGQIVRYMADDDGDLMALHRPLCKAERQGNRGRAEIRRGLLEYTEDVINLRKNLFPAYRPPLALAEELFVSFAANLSPAEKATLQGLVLDDYYCGEGLV